MALFENQVPHLELSVVGPEESVQRSVLHVLGDDHDGVGLGDDALQEDDVGVLELAHDGGLGQKVDLGLVRAARLERLDGHQHVPGAGAAVRRHAEAAAADVAELAAADDGLDRDVLGVDLLGELRRELKR